MNDSNLELFVIDEYDIYIHKIKYGYALHIKNLRIKTYDIYNLYKFRDIRDIREAVELTLKFINNRIPQNEFLRLLVSEDI